MSLVDTTRTSGGVRFRAAIRGIADTDRNLIHALINEYTAWRPGFDIHVAALCERGRREQGSLSRSTRELVGWVEPFAKPIAFVDATDGCCFAPPILRADVSYIAFGGGF